MSAEEEIWLDPGHGDADRAADELAAALGMRVDREGTRSYVVTDEDPLGPGVRVWGPVDANLDRDLTPTRWPDDWGILRDYPLVWTIRARPIESYEELLELTRLLFDRIAAVLPWRAALTHNIDQLVATFDPERGVREFPPGTRADARDRDIWG